MTKIEKLKKELSKNLMEIKRLEERKINLENEIQLEEQKELQKIMKSKNLTFEELVKIINN